MVIVYFVVCNRVPKGRIALGQQRFYRHRHIHREGWVSFQAWYRETDLWIRARHSLEQEALESVLRCRHQLEYYLAGCPEFLPSLVPLPDDPLAPPLARHMLQASAKAGVGPMASVAGAIAQAVAADLKKFTDAVIVENGGDCFFDLDEETIVGIYAGETSPFRDRIALRFTAERFPLGICTSSGTIGHSLSFGRADAVTIVSPDAALADAAATAVGNLVKTPGDIQKALDLAGSIPGVEGVLILIQDQLGAWGNLEVVPLQVMDP
jgi:uncharacterized protein